MAVKRNYRINLRNYGNPPAVMVSQYDENYSLTFEVYDGPLPASGLNTYTVKLVGTRADTLKYSFDGTVTGVANNVLNFTIDTTMTACAGKGVAEIVILDATNDVKFASFNLPVYVEKAAVPDDAVDADVERAQEIAEQVEELIDGATEGAEAWAVGQRGGVDVESTDPTYHNNSKYYAEQAQDIADSIGIDATLSISGKAADAKKTGDEISSLKEELNSVRPTATASDVGKALIVKTVEDGVPTEFEYGDAGGADPEAIEQAVTDWLDDHPEATTTVQDGSITEAKLAAALVPTIKNNYVTPEMFGAVGDGKTDDAQAFIDMFASDNMFFFIPSKTYVIGASVDIEKTGCTVLLNNTVFKPVDPHGDVNTYEYLIGIKALQVKMYGHFTLDCYHWINIGLWLSGAGQSYIDSVSVNGARLWGVCMDNTSWGNNSIFFRKLLCSQCGYKILAKAKYKETNVFELTDISERLFNTLTLDAKRSCFNNSYNSAEYVIDDSGYTQQYLANRAVYKSTLGDEAFVLNDDGTSGTFTMGSGVGWLRPYSDFVDGENGRNVFIPVGGGVKFGSAGSEGVFTIITLITASNPISFVNNMGYGGRIGSYSTEFDSVVMSMGISFDVDIGYMYAEGVGNGMTYNNNNRRIFLITENDYTFVNVHAPFHGQGTLNFYQYNQVVLNAQLSGPSNPVGVLFSTDTAVRQAQAFNYALGVATFNATITEHSPRTITAYVSGFNSTRTFIINLIDKNAKNVNMFAPVTAYIKGRYRDLVTPIKIILGSGMTDAGYSIYGAVNDILEIPIADYDYAVKLTFMLFGKVFHVKAEPLTFVDNTQT